MASQNQVSSSSPSNISLIAIFDFTQILGFVLLGIVLLTAALASTVRKSPGWFNFLSTWVLSCISYLVTLGQQTGEMPHFSICLLQAMLVYAAPAVTVTAGLCFIIEMWRIVSRVGASSGQGSMSFRDRGILIVAPYVVHLIICIEVLVLGLTRRELVTRNKTHMFCHLDSALPAYITGSVVICAIVIAMAFVASTAIHIRKHVAASRLFQGQQAANIEKTVVRFGIFTILPVFGLALSVAQVSARPTGVADGILTIAIGTLPAGAALIFGTQSDLMRVWCFWMRSAMLKSPLNATGRKPSQSV